MSNVLDLKAQFAANAERRKVDASGLYAAMSSFWPAYAKGFRVVTRDDDARNKNQNNLGMARYDASGPFSYEGTSALQDLLRWLAGYPRPDSEFHGASPQDGRAEIEVKVDATISGQKLEVWRNAATGEINQELMYMVDGREAGNV